MEEHSAKDDGHMMDVKEKDGDTVVVEEVLLQEIREEDQEE